MSILLPVHHALDAKVEDGLLTIRVILIGLQEGVQNAQLDCLGLVVEGSIGGTFSSKAAGQTPSSRGRPRAACRRFLARRLLRLEIPMPRPALSNLFVLAAIHERPVRTMIRAMWVPVPAGLSVRWHVARCFLLTG